MKADIFCCYIGTLLLDNSAVVLHGIVNGLAGFPELILFHFLLGALSLEQGSHVFCSWCQLCLPLFCQRAPRSYSKDLLNCSFNEWSAHLGQLLGQCMLPTGPRCPMAGPWLRHLAFASADLRSHVGGWFCWRVPESVTFSSSFYFAFWKILPPNKLYL